MPHRDRVLMGPGPSNPYPEVAEAFARPLLGHLDPDFLVVLDETCDRLRTVFRTDNELTLPISGTGSAGMEAAFVNFVGPGDTVVIGVNGVFGERMCDVAARCGAEVVRVEAEWGQPIEPQRLAAAHAAPKIIAVVHAETSTGVRNDIEPLGSLKGDALLLVDCVTSLGGIPVEIDGWGIDIAYSGTQKCLGVPPGLAPLTVNARAREQFVERSQSWYLDLRMIADYAVSGSGRKYHHTAPTAMVVALHAASARCSTKGSKPVGRDMRSAGGSCTRASRSRASRCSPRRVIACPSSPPPGCPTTSPTKPPCGARCSTATASRSVGAGRVRREGVAHRVHGAHGAAPQRGPVARRTG